MEKLLTTDFIDHYKLTFLADVNISVTTNAKYFEIEDDENRETKLHFEKGAGVAAYKNMEGCNVVVINYDKFITALPHIFQQGLGRCDLIVYTDGLKCFLLNELKNRKPNTKVRSKAIKQLIASLTTLMSVPSIRTYINQYKIRQCCFFNKQVKSPGNLSATIAFNRINTISTKGLKMSISEIELYEFEFYEYSGNQIYDI